MDESGGLNLTPFEVFHINRDSSIGESSRSTLERYPIERDRRVGDLYLILRRITD
jgi:hypothetical protein